MQIMSSEVTESKIYVKAIFPKMEGEVKKGDIVQSGIVISNSEVGSGSVIVQPLIYRLVCLNGMILPDSKMSKYHVGREQGMGSDISELLSDETREVSDRAFWMSVRDIVKASFDQVNFTNQLDKLREAAGIEIESTKIEKVVEVTQKKFGFSDDVRGSVLTHLIKGGDLSKWGLSNAVTRTANDQEDYELATMLESAGGKIIELGRAEWKEISTAS